MMRKNTAVQRWISASLLYGALGISACTAAQPPAALSQAEVAVRQASESKAPLYAPVELQSARNELDNARLAMDVREYEQARRLAEQALADARLAEVRAGTLSTRESARDLRMSSEAVRDEAVRLAALY